MRKDISKLREDRAALKAQFDALVTKAETADLTEDESKALDKHEADIKAMDKRIDLLVRQASIGDRADKADPVIKPESPRPEADREPLRIEHIPYSGNLTAYKGPDAARRAYTVGMTLKAAIGTSGNQVNTKARQWCENQGIDYSAVMSGNNNTAGGAFVFDQFSTAVIDLVEQYGVFAANASPYPMNTGDNLIVPRITSGLTAYFAGESTEPTNSDLGTDSVQLVAKGLSTMTKIPRELLDDSAISLAEILTRKIALAVATKQDQCGFKGDGTSTYGGIQGIITKANAGTIYTAASGNTAFSTLDKEDFLGMIGKLPQFPGIQPKWYISKPGWADSMARIEMAQGGSTSGELRSGPGVSFLGYPVVWVSLNTLNDTLTAQTSTTGLCLFGDLSMACAMGVRRAMTVESDFSRYFELRQVAVMGWTRFDINYHSPGDSSNAGPIVVLKTPGS